METMPKKQSGITALLSVIAETRALLIISCIARTPAGRQVYEMNFSVKAHTVNISFIDQWIWRAGLLFVY